MNFECLRFIREELLTPHEARDLEHLGFEVCYVGMGALSKDRYRVYAKIKQEEGPKNDRTRKD